MVVLHRLLEPRVAEILKRAADPHGATDGIAVVGVEAEHEVIPERLANSLRLRDVARDIDVLLGAIAIPPNLDGSRVFLLDAPRDDFDHFVHGAPGVTANRGIAGQA